MDYTAIRGAQVSRLKRFSVNLLATLSIVAIAGCATAPAPMYQWGGYQRNVYNYLKHDTAAPSEQLRAMQTLLKKSRTDGTRLPPGFHAHIAMLHIQMDQFDDAKQQLEAEKTAFPESTHYMNFLLKQMNEKKS